MRTHYENGDEIGLQATGCDGCTPCMVNGILTHESGCPESWRDYPAECRGCGCAFFRESSDERYCCVECSEF